MHLLVQSVATSEPDAANAEGSRSTKEPRSDSRTRGAAALAALAGPLALLGLSLAACSSNSSSPTTTVSSRPVIQRSGSGSKTLGSVTLSTKWIVTWKFNCTNPVTASRFLLTATKSGGSPISITDQTGLGGGGTKAYNQTGTFTFAVATPCTWNLLVGPPSVGTSTTTTSSSTTSST